MVSDRIQAIVESLTHRREIRSADKANLKRMLGQMKKGQPLSYQERQQLWAYISRYHRDDELAGADTTGAGLP